MKTKKNAARVVIAALESKPKRKYTKRAAKWAEKTVAVESKPKRKYTKRAAKWANVDENPMKKAVKKIDKTLLRKTKKESVMKLGKKEKNAAKKAMREMIEAEKAAIKTIARNCKLRAKELAKMEDDEAKQALIAKLIKIGYEFDVSDPTKLVVSVNVNATVVPKMKKLKPGVKAVAIDENAKQPVVETPKTEEKIEIIPTETIPTIELKPIVEEPIVEETNPIEVPMGDTFTDSLNVSGPTDDELDAIEAEDSDETLHDERDDIENYRAEFFSNLAEEGDDSNL